jgi:hypothetical protein
VEEADAYHFQVAADPAFAQVVYECTRTPWSAHCPSKALDAGIARYYWRYAALDAEDRPSNWSKVRSFTLAQGAVANPLPPFAELCARIPRDHPRLLLRPGDIPHLRDLTTGGLAEHWRSILAQAGKWIENPPDATEPPLYPEGTNVKGEAWKKIWWGNHDRSMAAGEAAATLAFVYLLSGEEKYGQASHDLVMAVAQWDPQGATEYEYNDEAAMPLLYLTARAYSWAYPFYSEEERAKVRAVMRERGRQCFEHLGGNRHFWSPYESHRNRAWHFLGELAMAFIDEIPEAGRWLDYAVTILYTCYPVWGDDDGGWHEGVPYWKSYLERFGFWALAMNSAFGIQVFDRPFFHRAGNFALYMAPPGTEHTAFGDMSSNTRTPADCSPLLAMLAAGAKNPHWKWYADTVGSGFRKDTIGFLLASRSLDLVGEPPLSLPPSACFRGAGIAVMNSNLLDAKANVQLFFKSSPLGSVSHGFNANNSFHLNVFGQPALLNTGRRDVHGSPHHKQWMWSTRSQNAILVDGEGQTEHSPRAIGRITHFETSSTVDIVAGEAGRSYEVLDRWTRAMVFLKPDVILIHDVLVAPYAATFDWLVHAPGEFLLDPNGGSPSALWEGERGRVSIHFLAPEGLSVSQKDGYDPPPADWAGFSLNEWHLTAHPNEKVRQQEFVTLIRVNQNAPEYQYKRTSQGHALSIDRGTGKVEVGLDRDGVRVLEGDRVHTIQYSPHVLD